MNEKNFNEEKELKTDIPENNEQVEEKNLTKLPNKKIGIIPIVLSGICGMVIGAGIVLGLWKTNTLDIKVIAKTKQGNYTQSMFYNNIRDKISINYVIEGIDEMLMNKDYQLTDEQNKEIDEQIEKVLNLYKAYGYTEELFLSQNGFDTKEEFRHYLGLDYQRNLVYIDYLKTKIPEEDVKKFYDENVYGEINTKHMLVQVTDDVTDEDAKSLAEEIIKKLDSGKEFDEVAKEYGDKIKFEEIGYNGFNSGLAKEYEEASKKMEKGTYSKEPVKTSFGYHVIYKIDQKEMPSLDEARNDIVEVLGADFEKEDKNIRYKALIKFREDNGVEFKDEKLKKEYEDYCKQYDA